MTVPSKPITPALLAEARRLYIQTQVPVDAICTMLGIGTYTFYQRLKKWGWPMRSKRIPVETPPAAPEEEPADGRDESAAVPVRTAQLVGDLQRAAGRELAKLDRIVAKIGDERGDLPDMQQALRSRAMAGRLLRETITIEQMNQDPGTRDDGFPRSDNELRRELLRKMDALIARREK